MDVARHRLALFQRGKHLKQNLVGPFERCIADSSWYAARIHYYQKYGWLRIIYASADSYLLARYRGLRMSFYLTRINVQLMSRCAQAGSVDVLNI